MNKKEREIQKLSANIRLGLAHGSLCGYKTQIEWNRWPSLFLVWHFVALVCHSCLLARFRKQEVLLPPSLPSPIPSSRRRRPFCPPRRRCGTRGRTNGRVNGRTDRRREMGTKFGRNATKGRASPTYIPVEPVSSPANQLCLRLMKTAQWMFLGQLTVSLTVTSSLSLRTYDILLEGWRDRCRGGSRTWDCGTNLSPCFS